MLPIIIVSALSQAELDRVKEQYPALPILQKPFKPNQLLQLVNEAKAAPSG